MRNPVPISELPPEAPISIRQVPALMRRLATWGVLRPGMRNFDVGGGSYEDTTRFLEDQGVLNLVVDPYARTPEENVEAFREAALEGVDAATLANVLNVIPRPQDRREVLEIARAFLRPGASAWISIYEGRGDGRRRQGAGGTQEHRKTEYYLGEIQKVFRTVRMLPGKVVQAIP